MTVLGRYLRTHVDVAALLGLVMLMSVLALGHSWFQWRIRADVSQIEARVKTLEAFAASRGSVTPADTLQAIEGMHADLMEWLGAHSALCHPSWSQCPPCPQ